jgi:hypothetical protein
MLQDYLLIRKQGCFSLIVLIQKKQVLCKSLCSDILHARLFKGLGWNDFKILYLNPVCDKSIEQLCWWELEKLFFIFITVWQFCQTSGSSCIFSPQCSTIEVESTGVSHNDYHTFTVENPKADGDLARKPHAFYSQGAQSDVQMALLDEGWFLKLSLWLLRATAVNCYHYHCCCAWDWESWKAEGTSFCWGYLVTFLLCSAGDGAQGCMHWWLLTWIFKAEGWRFWSTYG